MDANAEYTCECCQARLQRDYADNNLEHDHAEEPTSSEKEKEQEQEKDIEDCARVVDLTRRIRDLKRQKKRPKRGGKRNNNGAPAAQKTNTPEPTPSAIADAVYNSYIVAEGHRPTAITLTTVASVHTSDKTIPPKRTETFILEEARKHKLKLDTALYNAIVTAYIRKGIDNATASRLIDDMRSRGVQPDINTYCELLPCLARMRQRALVDEMLDAMIEVDNIQVTQSLTESLIAAYCEVESLADAEDVVRRAVNSAKDTGRKGGPLRVTAKAFGPIINVHCSNGRPGEAWRILRDMRSNGVRPTLAIFNMLIKGFCKAQNISGAEGVVRELEGGGTWDMSALGITPDKLTYTTLLDFYASKGAVDQAAKVLERARNNGIVPDDVMWGTVIKSYARAGMPEKAEEVLYAAAKVFDKDVKDGHAPDGRGSPMNVVTFSTVVAAFCNMGFLEEALRVMCDMKQRGVAPNAITYSHVAWGYMNTGVMPSPTLLLSELETAGFDTRQNELNEDDDHDMKGKLLKEIDSGISMAVKTSDVLASFDGVDDTFDSVAFDAYRSADKDSVDVEMAALSRGARKNRRGTAPAHAFHTAVPPKSPQPSRALLRRGHAISVPRRIMRTRAHVF